LQKCYKIALHDRVKSLESGTGLETGFETKFLMIRSQFRSWKVSSRTQIHGLGR